MFSVDETIPNRRKFLMLYPNLDVSEMFVDRQAQRSTMHARHLNEQLVRVLKTIGYDVGFQRGTGQYLFDRDGARYLDLLRGFGVFAIGRNHPVWREALKSVLAQRMVRRLCPACRVQDQLPYPIGKAKDYAKIISEFKNPTVYRMPSPEEFAEKGPCKTCGSTGVAGQRVVFEFLRVTEAIEDAIVNEAPRSFLERAALEDEETGYLPMRYHALELILNGETSLAEVEQASIEMTES